MENELLLKQSSAAECFEKKNAIAFHSTYKPKTEVVKMW